MKGLIVLEERPRSGEWRGYVYYVWRTDFEGEGNKEKGRLMCVCMYVCV